MEEYRLHKLTWPELAEIQQMLAAVMIPVGSTEQHGPHLPFDTDTFTSAVLADRIAAECLAEGIRVLVTPPVNFGVSWYHMDFAGTMSVSTEVYIPLIKDLLRCLVRHRFRNLVLLNSHGGNTAALTVAINDFYEETREKVYLVNWASVAADRIQSMGIRSPLIHSEEVETSVAMALGQRTLLDRRTRDCFSRREVYEQKGFPTSSHVSYDALNPGHGIILPMDFIKDISTSGIVGDATLGTREKGDEIVRVVIQRVKEMISELAGRVSQEKSK